MWLVACTAGASRFVYICELVGCMRGSPATPCSRARGRGQTRREPWRRGTLVRPYARGVQQKDAGTRDRGCGRGVTSGRLRTDADALPPPLPARPSPSPCLVLPPLFPDVSGTTGAAGCRVLGGRQGKGRKGVWGLALILLGTGSETLGLAPFGPQLPIEAQKVNCLWIPEQGLERNNMDTRARGHLVAPLPDHARGPPIARGPDTMVAVDAPAAGLPSRGLLPGNTRPTPHAATDQALRPEGKALLWHHLTGWRPSHRGECHGQQTPSVVRT